MSLISRPMSRLRAVLAVGRLAAATLQSPVSEAAVFNPETFTLGPGLAAASGTVGKGGSPSEGGGGRPDSVW